jgi:hypothetical protein
MFPQCAGLGREVGLGVFCAKLLCGAVAQSPGFGLGVFSRAVLRVVLGQPRYEANRQLCHHLRGAVSGRLRRSQVCRQDRYLGRCRLCQREMYSRRVVSQLARLVA